MNQRTTIYDIAREAGVSAKTVSKVLNNKPGVGSETRDRVRAIIEAVGYHPHHGARALRGRRFTCVGVTMAPPLQLLPLSQDFLLWLFAKLSEMFSSRGAYLSFDLSPRTGAIGTGDYGRGVWERLYDVCLVLGPLPLDDTVLRRIHGAGIPYLALGCLADFPEASTATVDFFEGAYQSTRFLLERGHRRIALLAAFEGYQAGLDRVLGYKQALQEFGCEPDGALIQYYNPMSDALADVATAVMRAPGVTALIDATVAEDCDSLRLAAQQAGRGLDSNLECVVWTYMKDAAVLPEAAAHLWVPVREAAIEGIERLARWIDKQDHGPISLRMNPVLTDAEHRLELRKPLRIAELL